MIVFEDRIFKEVTEYMRSLGWVLIQYDWCPYIRGEWETGRHRENHVRTQGEDGHLQTKETGLRRNQPC